MASHGPSKHKKPNNRRRKARPTLETLEDRLVPAVNPIITENLLPGNPQSEWDVVSGGDSNIEGFTTDISVDQGQTVQFKINTDSTDYRLDIYRMGYYGGMGARKVATIQNQLSQPQDQPAPLTDEATGLIDAGNWSVSATWNVPTNATSGIYFAKLVRQDAIEGANHVFFVVRDDDGSSDLLFQTSDTTWQAYNTWGGKSLYDITSAGGRAYALSYNRPFTTRTIPGGMGETNWVYWAEYPMVRWLEANGFDVSYFSNVDTARRGAELLEHKIFLSVGHDEYWSAEMFAAAEAARDAGVNLAFFSGNELYWKVRWEQSIDSSGTAFRTLVCYKESMVGVEELQGVYEEPIQVAPNGGIPDPSPIWTGLWRDLRFSPPGDAKVEQLLTGQIFSVNRGPGGTFGTSIEVPEADGKMRFWRSTTVATLQPGEVATLSNGTLGYEWDEDVDNGFRPAGIIRLSLKTENVPEKLVDPISWPGCGGIAGSPCAVCRGCMVAPGTATHSMTMYRAASGAIVFGAGTVQWSWGLDGKHDGGITVPDVRMQQATVNLFADMGVAAGDLQAGLIQTVASTDFIAPDTTITSIPDGLVIQSGAQLTISGTATDTGGGVVGGVEISLDGGVVWRRAEGRGSWTYTWAAEQTGVYDIVARASDDSVNLETSWAAVGITVVADDATAPALSGVETNLVNNQTVTIDWQTDESATSQVVYGTSPSSLNLSLTDLTMVTAHSITLNNLTPNTTYYYRVISTDEFNNTTTFPSLSEAPRSFSTPAFSDTTAADFATGTLDAGTYLTLTGNGEVTLAPTLGSEFSGTSLSEAWSVVSTRSGGSVVVASGAATINGATQANAFMGPGRSLEAIATFSGAPFQALGFDTDFDQGSRAIFSTYAGGSLYARSKGGTTTIDTQIPGNWLGTPHQFRVDWTPTGVEYWIDGTRVVVHPVLITNSMRPAASDFEAGGGALVVDSVRVTPYALSGSYTSRVLDGGAAVFWSAFDWIADTPAGTSLDMQLRMGNSAAPDAGWTDWISIASGGMVGGTSRYLQYRANLTSSDGYRTPVLETVTVSYNTSQTDNIAPSVATQSPSPGSLSILPVGPVVVTFNELMDAASFTATSLRLRKVGDASDVPAELTFQGATATLQPDASLFPDSSYQVTLSGSVRDAAGNLLGGDIIWTFTTGWETLLNVTFDGGQPTGTAAGAEVTLASAANADFGGTSLAPGWSSTAWHANGSTIVNNGIVSVEGARVGPDTLFGPGRSLEFQATFSGAPWQHIGLSLDFTNPPFAIFSSFLGGALYARTSGSANEDTLIPGNWLGAPHLYRIDWNPASIDYFIDGSLVASHAITVAGSLRPIASDFDVDANPLQVDWMRLGPFTPAGEYLSSIYDAGSVVTWSDANWSSVVPAGTSLAISVRMGNTPTPDSSWTSFVPLAGPGAQIGGVSQYLQYRAELAATVPGVTPLLQDVNINYAASTGGPLGGGIHDTIAPTIAAQSPAPGAVDVSRATTIDISFSELIDPGSIAGNVRLRAVGATEDVMSLVTFGGSTATLQPMLPLASNTIYQVTVDGDVGDGVGNVLGSDVVWTFTTEALSYVDATAADFAAGTTDANTYVTQTGNGELILAPTTGSEFSGSALPPNWSTLSWQTGGGATVGGGVVTIDGGRVGPDVLYAPGGSLEFVATFSGDPYQHIGLSVDFNGVPYAIFSTSSGGGLYARTSGSATMDTLIPGNWLAAPHLFRIDWNPASIDYFIDGSLVASHAVVVSGSLRPLASDYNVNGSNLVIDWLRLGPQADAGTFLSRVLDAGAEVAWHSASWTSSTPTGTSIDISVRMGNTPTPDSSWTDYIPLAGSGATIGGGSRYFQYRANLASSVPNVTPILHDLTLAGDTQLDAIAPTVLFIGPAAGATEVNPAAAITVKFNELMNPATIDSTTFRVRAQGASTDEPALVTYSGSTATLQPTLTLAGNTTYQVTLAGAVADLAGNALGGDIVWNFTTQDAGQTTLTDTDIVDFEAGVHSNVYITGNGGGQLALAPAAGAEFTGAALPGGWSSAAWNPGGSANVGGGVVSIDGSRLGPDALFGPGRSLEFMATFGGSAYQHAGFSFDFSNPPYALFSSWSGNGLYARTSGSGVADTLIPGNWFGAPHVFRIDWNTDSIVYFIDGNQVASHAITVTGSLRPLVSDFNIDGNNLVVDWMRLGPIATSGSFVSQTLDAGVPVTWSSATWNGTTPAGTTLGVSVRMGDTPFPDSTWTDFIPLGASGAVIGGRSHFLQYRVDLASSVAGLTPAFSDITITYSTGADTVAPHIVSQTPAQGATGIGLLAPITVKFSELMNLPTIMPSSFHVRAVGSTTDVPAIVSVSGSTAVLRPTIALAGHTDYEVILDAAITDTSGNALGSGAVWAFETGVGLWQQDTAANFNTGVLNGVVVSQEEDGELQLAPAFADDFSGIALGSSWVNLSWSTGPDAIVVSGGTLSLAGTAIYSTQSYENVPIEGRVQFAPAPWQHFGLATSFDSFAGNYWAKFSTAGTSDRLFARVNVSGATQDVDLGPLPSGFHDYKVDPAGGVFRFYVDGVLRTTIAMSFPAGTATKVAFSSFNGSTTLQADSVRVLSYALTGTFTSAVFDATRVADWGTMSFTADLPPGCQIIVETRSGDTVLLGGSGTQIIVGDETSDSLVSGFGDDWSDWEQVANGGDIASPSARYMQYRVTLITSDPSLTPVLRDILFGWI
ncbi:MAG: Ig-like domain-containing protein [Gemmataceae bacterium]|nr:Ig-like domain-containing protein [Gemmataceae bacterium]